MVAHSEIKGGRYSVASRAPALKSDLRSKMLGTNGVFTLGVRYSHFLLLAAYTSLILNNMVFLKEKVQLLPYLNLRNKFSTRLGRVKN
jgi:hypothetical protein